MPTFNYKAKDKKGSTVNGVVEAKDKKTALAIIREKGLFCFTLNEKKENILIQINNRFFNKVGISDLSAFTRQLATMVAAGLPLTDALFILRSQGKGLLSKATDEILRDIQGGSTLADALKKYPKIFSPVYVSLVRAGESAGVLDNILSRLADNLETQREFQSKIKGALLYPIIIVVGMGAVMLIMMVLVIPKLTSLYSEFDAELPPTTQILISISNFMVKFWWMMILGLVGLGYLYKAFNKTAAGKRKLDELKFKIPIAGKLQNQVILAEFTRTLGLLVGAGVSIVEALQISSKTANNLVIEEGINVANEQVEKGFPLSSALMENPVFPPILGQMLSVGEETGKLDEVLLKVSKFFQSESEESLKGLTTAIEPLIMILLGVGVGFLVIAIILPIYNLTSQF
jgi:type IV pilus assembly protein PilC